MNVTVEKSSAVYGIIKVDVVEADYSDKVNKELKEVGKKRAIPGFRAGHVPMSVFPYCSDSSFTPGESLLNTSA